MTIRDELPHEPEAAHALIRQKLNEHTDAINSLIETNRKQDERLERIEEKHVHAGGNIPRGRRHPQGRSLVRQTAHLDRQPLVRGLCTVVCHRQLAAQGGMMDGKRTRMAAGALGIGAALLVAIATHEGYRGEAYT